VLSLPGLAFKIGPIPVIGPILVIGIPILGIGIICEDWTNLKRKKRSVRREK
jgi:hypothetical protein